MQQLYKPPKRFHSLLVDEYTASNKFYTNPITEKCHLCNITDINAYSNYKLCSNCSDNPNICIPLYNISKLYGLTKKEIANANLTYYDNCVYYIYVTKEIEELADKKFTDKKIDRQMQKYLKTKEQRNRVRQLDTYIETTMDKNLWHIIKSLPIYDTYVQTGEYFSDICRDMKHIYDNSNLI